MNTKRIMRWVIVLFLLAALPVMTAVMAQGQEPAEQLPVVTEPGESAPPLTYTMYESEPNNTRATADVFGKREVMGGKIDSADDIDFFWFYIYDGGDGDYVLIDVDAASINSPLDSYICLYEIQGSVIACSNDSDTRDSLLFHSLIPGKYYISIEGYQGSGGSNYDYELILSTPLLISAAAANLGTGNVAGIPFKSEDILAYSWLQGMTKWVMFFDGSDVGIKTTTNIATNRVTPGMFEQMGDNLLIGVGKNQSLGSIGTVTQWDVLEFDPVQYGPNTIGTFSRVFRGSQSDLTTAAEKIDALDSAGGNILVSTVGTATVPYYMGYNIKLKDEDVTTWDFWNEEWYPSFVGSSVPGLASEDVIATSTQTGNTRLMTILGNGNIDGTAVTQKDIFGANGSLYWHGPDYGWNYNIDAFEWRPW